MVPPSGALWLRLPPPPCVALDALSRTNPPPIKSRPFPRRSRSDAPTASSSVYDHLPPPRLRVLLRDPRPRAGEPRSLVARIGFTEADLSLCTLRNKMDHLDSRGLVGAPNTSVGYVNGLFYGMLLGMLGGFSDLLLMLLNSENFMRCFFPCFSLRWASVQVVDGFFFLQFSWPLFASDGNTYHFVWWALIQIVDRRWWWRCWLLIHFLDHLCID